VRNDSPPAVTLPLSAMVTLAVETWRLSDWLARIPPAVPAGPARHVLRRMEEMLTLCELEVVSLDQRAYDAGLAATVIDTVDDPELPGGKVVIDQTLSPMVLRKGEVVRNAEVTTRRGTGK
jgi:hypothetical protein